MMLPHFVLMSKIVTLWSRKGPSRLMPEWTAAGWWGRPPQLDGEADGHKKLPERTVKIGRRYEAFLPVAVIGKIGFTRDNKN